VTWTQFTQEQRYQIYALLKTEYSQIKIPEVAGVQKLTIYRDITREEEKEVNLETRLKIY
jgi:IS30 family transposase